MAPALAPNPAALKPRVGGDQKTTTDIPLALDTPAPKPQVGGVKLRQPAALAPIPTPETAQLVNAAARELMQVERGNKGKTLLGSTPLPADLGASVRASAPPTRFLERLKSPQGSTRVGAKAIAPADKFRNASTMTEAPPAPSKADSNTAHVTMLIS